MNNSEINGNDQTWHETKSSFVCKHTGSNEEVINYSGKACKLFYFVSKLVSPSDSPVYLRLQQLATCMWEHRYHCKHK